MLGRILFFFSFFLIANVHCQENCDNGIDDDGDGLIDLNDSIDCVCNIKQVLDNSIVSSILENGSFEKDTCCPKTHAKVECLENWINASSSTSPDYFNLCGFKQMAAPPDPPVANGSGYAGIFVNPGYIEFIGNCLRSPLDSGYAYKLDLYTALSEGDTAVNLAVFGSPNCADMPWIGQGCPVGLGSSWELLGSHEVNYSTVGQWLKITIILKPLADIQAIAIGAKCKDADTNFVSSYYYLDELTLSLDPFFGDIIATGDLCTEDLVLHENFNIKGDNVQWYLNGIALIGETSDTVNGTNYGAGTYSLMNFHTDSCEVSSYYVERPIYPSVNFSTIGYTCLGKPLDLEIDLTGNSAQLLGWELDMGDGNSAPNSLHQHYVYKDSGRYNIKLTMYSTKGCVYSEQKEIVVAPLQEAKFELVINGDSIKIAQNDTVYVCAADTVYFVDKTTIDYPYEIETLHWVYGDINNSDPSLNMHSYTTPGIFKVMIATLSNYKCRVDFSCNIFVKEKPTASFENINQICANELVEFHNFSTDPTSIIVGYKWQFGDGKGSDLINPSHYFDSGGKYDVKLMVENNEGCKDEIINEIEIWSVPDVDFENSLSCQNKDIKFLNNSKIEFGSIIENNWKFGNGFDSDKIEPIQIFTKHGIYDVELICISDKGCQDTLVKTLIIHPQPIINFKVYNVCLKEPLNLNNFSNVPIGTIDLYNWQFGDAKTSTLEKPTNIIYDKPGKYQITLEATSNKGCKNSNSKIVEIYNLPQIALSEEPKKGCEPFKASFNQLNKEHVDECNWDFGDGVTSDNCSKANHTYSKGIYDLSLQVSSEHGCVDSVYRPGYIEVYDQPIASFNFTPELISKLEKKVKLYNTSKNSHNYEWEFNDGAPINTEVNPSHTFKDVGKQVRISLYVANESQTCFDEIEKIIPVENPVILYVPNAFSPGVDGRNEVFKPIVSSGVNIYSYTLTVYNRWGEILFISHNPSVGWNGTFQKNKLVKPGVYVWQIEFEAEESNTIQIQKGSVLLMN